MIRSFTAQDADQAATLHQACFTHDPWPAHAFTTLLKSGAACFIATDDTNEILGLILYRIAADEAEILTFAVIPNQRNNGVGGTLLQKAIEVLRDQKIKRIFLEVAQNNHAAISLYSKASFTIVGERSGYYVNPDGIIDAYIMEKSILEGH